MFSSKELLASAFLMLGALWTSGVLARVRPGDSVCAVRCTYTSRCAESIFSGAKVKVFATSFAVLGVRVGLAQSRRLSADSRKSQSLCVSREGNKDISPRRNFGFLSIRRPAFSSRPRVYMLLSLCVCVCASA